MSRPSSNPNHPEPTDHGDASSSDPMFSDDSGKSPGEALAKFDFSNTDLGSHTDLGAADLGSQGPDQSDMHAALASMSLGEALDYAISQMGSADQLDGSHFDAGHFDMPPPDTSHDA